MGAPKFSLWKVLAYELRQSLWLGINFQIPPNSQVLGGRGGSRSNPVTVYPHAPHIPSPRFLLELLVCSGRELTFRFTSITAEG